MQGDPLVFHRLEIAVCFGIYYTEFAIIKPAVTISELTGL